MTGPSNGRDVAFLTAEKILQLGSIAIVNVILVRALGPEKFGFLGSATAILAIAIPLASFGQVSVIRFISAGGYSSVRLTRFAGLLSTCSSVLAGLAMIALAFSPLFQVEPTHHLLLILSLAVLARPLSAADAYFQATGQNGVAAATRVASLIVPTILRVQIAFGSQSLDQLAWVLVIENVTAGLFMTVAYIARRRRGSVELRVSRAIPHREILAQSIPLLVAGLAVILYLRVSYPLLLLLANSAEVSYFSAATNLVDALSFVPTMLFTAFLPKLVQSRQVALEIFNGQMEKVLRFTAGLGVIFTLGGLVFGPLVIWLLYGPEYSESGVVVQILFLGCPFIFIGVMRHVWIVTEGLQRETLVGSSLALAINVAANFALIPTYGAVGAAVAALLAHATNGVLSFALFKSTRSIFVESLVAMLPWKWFPVVLSVVKHRRLL